MTDQSTLEVRAKAGRKKTTFEAAKKLDAVFEEKLVKKQQNSAKNIDENRKNLCFPIEGNF